MQTCQRRSTQAARRAEAFLVKVATRAIFAVVVALAAGCGAIILVMVGQGVTGVADVFRVDSVAVVEVTRAREHDVALDLFLHGQAALRMINDLDELADMGAKILRVFGSLDVAQIPAVLIVAGIAFETVLEALASTSRVSV